MTFRSKVRIEIGRDFKTHDMRSDGHSMCGKLHNWNVIGRGPVTCGTCINIRRMNARRTR